MGSGRAAASNAAAATPARSVLVLPRARAVSANTSAKTAIAAPGNVRLTGSTAPPSSAAAVAPNRLPAPKVARRYARPLITKARQTPIAASADTVASAIAASRTASAAPDGRRANAPSRIEPDRKPALAEHSSDDEHDQGDRTGQREVPAPDREQAAEEQRLDARVRVEDVACKDHAERKCADEHERGERVVAAPARVREALDAEHEPERRCKCTERAREPEPVREDEAGKRGRGDGV